MKIDESYKPGCHCLKTVSEVMRMWTFILLVTGPRSLFISSVQHNRMFIKNHTLCIICNCGIFLFLGKTSNKVFLNFIYFIKLKLKHYL